MKPRRVGNEARKGLAIASSHGTATAAPMPRRSVRREIGWMLIVRLPPLILYASPAPQAERIAFYDFDDQRRKLVLVLRNGGQRLIEGTIVIGLDPSAQRVDDH